MNDIEIKIEATLKDFQKDIIKAGLDYSKKNLIIMASRQIGKSFALRLLSLLYLSEESSFVGYVTLTCKLGNLFYSELYNLIPSDLISKSNSKDLIIELVNGSKIQFFSIESIETVRGYTLTHLIIDECAFAKETTPNGQNIFNNILNPLVDAKGKKIIFCSTPFGKRGLFWETYLKSTVNEDGKWDLIKATIYDDPTKTKEWIEDKKNEITELAWKQEYLCEFLDESSTFFKDYGDLFILEDKDLNDSKFIYAGVDFSSVGDDRTIITFMDSSGKTIQYEVTGSLDDKYKTLAYYLDLYDNLKVAYIEVNSIGAVMWNEIKKLLKINKNKVKEFNTTAKSKPEILTLLAKDIESKNLTFAKDNNLLYSELGTFSYTINPNTKHVKYEALPGCHDDTVMSLAICNYARNTGKRMSNINRVMTF